MITYAGIIEREKTIIIDGYSSAKTVKGAIADFGRYIKKHVNEKEGKAMIEYKEECLCHSKNSEGGYFLEVEDVPCATNMNTDTNDVEYKEGYNFYLVCRIVK